MIRLFKNAGTRSKSIQKSYKFHKMSNKTQKTKIFFVFHIPISCTLSLIISLYLIAHLLLHYLLISYFSHTHFSLTHFSLTHITVIFSELRWCLPPAGLGKNIVCIWHLRTHNTARLGLVDYPFGVLVVTMGTTFFAQKESFLFALFRVKKHSATVEISRFHRVVLNVFFEN